MKPGAARLRAALMQFAQLLTLFHSFSSWHCPCRMTFTVPFRRDTMPNNPIHHELDSPFTWRELGVSLGCALVGVTAIALLVNLWLLPVQML